VIAMLDGFEVVSQRSRHRERRIAGHLCDVTCAAKGETRREDVKRFTIGNLPPKIAEAYMRPL
jgi:hypothetical protein